MGSEGRYSIRPTDGSIGLGGRSGLSCDGFRHLNLSVEWLQSVLFLDEVELHPAVTLAAVVGPVLICRVPFTPADGAHQVGWDTDISEVFTHHKGAFG